jgi:hypothetical protein
MGALLQFQGHTLAVLKIEPPGPESSGSIAETPSN